MKQADGVSRETLERAIGRVLLARGLDAASSPALATLLELVAADHRSLTAVRDPIEAVAAHVADSLDGLLARPVRDAGRLLDLGAGAGLPGLVLATVRPELAVTLVDSVGRKVAFIQEAAEAMGLANVTALHGRVEELAELQGRFDVVTARAVAPLGVLVEWAAPVLREGGALVAYKGRADPAEEADAAAAASLTGMGRPEAVPVPPRRGAADRRLYVVEKAGPTPDRFPRRPGIARKRPLTAQEHAQKTR